MKNIIIIGARGYEKKYGGWETFVTNLINNYNDKDTKFYVPELTHDKNKKNKIETRNGVICPQIYTPKQGSFTMLTFAIKATIYFYKYIKKNKLDNTILYTLGYRVGPLFKILKNKFKKLNVKILINPDGIEWKREKWNKLVKLYLKHSEKTMINSSDYVICDSKNIQKYIDDKYNKPTTFIPYGAYIKDIKDIDKKTKDIMDKYNIKKREYYLVVARFVPENNLETIIKEYMKTNIKKDLIIISNIEKNKFYNKLIKETNFNKDKRIKLIGPIYDQDILIRFRKNAKGYIHGHSAGGTNPSLLEALSLTDINILYDVCYNKEVGSDACFYFNKEDNNLKNILEKVDKLKTKEINIYSNKAKNIIKNNYTWEIIIKKYKKIFNKILNEKE